MEDKFEPIPSLIRNFNDLSSVKLQSIGLMKLTGRILTALMGRSVSPNKVKVNYSEHSSGS